MTARPDSKPAGRRPKFRRSPSGKAGRGCGQHLGLVIAARSLAVVFLGSTIAYGLFTGDRLGDDGATARRLMGELAGRLGYAAGTVHINGLVHHAPEAVLQAIGVAPNGSLIGFDPSRARRLLENLDWVASATVQRIFPNQLQITLEERIPFAIWQRDGLHYVIDRSGSAISSLDPQRFRNLLVVTGEGAQKATSQLVNQLEARPQLRSTVKAAARVGDRRWNLYLASGIKVLLPEGDVGRALDRLVETENRYRLEARDVGLVDLRIDGQITLAPTRPAKAETAEIKVSRS
jgi:cell division protein FtsQ